MALKATVKTLDEVDAKYHDLYVKNEDGTFRLDAEGVEDVGALKNALARERELNKKKKDGDGLTDAEKTELTELRKQREEHEQKELEDKKNWEGLTNRLKEKHQNEMTAAEKKAQIAQDRLFKTLKENAATAAIVKNKGKVAPLIPHVISNLDVIEENGELQVVVKEKDGNKRYSKDSPKDVMSVEELIKTDFLNNDDFMGLFEGTGSSGSGSSTNPKGRSQGGAFTISRTDARDAQKYQTLKEQAAKAGAQVQIVD